MLGLLPIKRVLILLSAILLMASSAFGQDGFISARNFAETQGISYQWFPIQKMLVMRKGLKSVKLTVNETTASVDDKMVNLPAAPVIRDGQIMVPAAAIVRLFQGDLELQSPTSENLNTAPPVVNPTPPPAPPNIQIQPTQPLSPSPTETTIPAQPAPGEAVLVALRHSGREDHTRVVLEFSDNVTWTTEMNSDTFRLTIRGCRNLVPTRRTNPVGRHIKRLDINSGPDRSGLILNFQLPQSKKLPAIETVSNPFRMIISFFEDPDAIIASPTQNVVATVASAATEAKEQVMAQKNTVVEEKPPEINIEVPLESLANESFKGRTVVIDAGHGGADNGHVFPGRIPEKAINLAIARFLQQSLEKVGLKAVLIRNADVDMQQSQRISVANRHGTDLFISIHVGAARDLEKNGVSCIVYGKTGTPVSEKESGLTEASVYNDWLQGTRFDLASFLARKINERMKTHLKCESRGVKQLPLLPLKYVISPAVLVEVGMLSDKTEGKNLISSRYHEAVAAAITNGVVDFFNGIVIKP